MNKKINLLEIEKNIDFEDVTKKLDNLSSTGALKRRKKMSDLLDKVKPALLRARENKVSLQSLTDFLNSSGIPVSEPTLRKYLNLGKGGNKRRSKGSGKSPTKPPSPASGKGVVSTPVSQPSTKKLPPRLARREQK